MKAVSHVFGPENLVAWISLRASCGSLLRRYAWLPTLALLGAISVFLFVTRAYPLSAFLICAFTACITTAFTAGYVLRMKERWPRLHEFRRSEYARVWDTLSSTPREAEAAAAGMTGESNLRTSGTEIAMRIAAATGLKKTDDVLEIACGVGRVGWAIACLSNSWRGCDVSAKMTSHARNRLAGISNAQVIHLSGSGLQAIKSASIDVVYCTNALPHLDQTERWLYVSEAYRVLREGGRLYIDTISLDTPEGWAMVVNNLTQRKRGANPPYAPTPSTSDELLAYYAKAGFSITQVDRHGSLLSVIGLK